MRSNRLTATGGLILLVVAAAETACLAAEGDTEPNWRAANPELVTELRRREAAAPESVKRQIRRLRGGNPAGRANAAVAVAAMGEKAEGAVLALISLLDDKTEVLRRDKGWKTTPAAEASDALAAVGKPAVEALIAVFEDGPRDVSLKWTLQNILAVIGDRRALAPLLAEEPRCLVTTCLLDQIDKGWRESETAKRAVPDLIAALGNDDADV
ncbi:MAG: hypothetical protein R6V58_11935, partial [Planctomycetota bacterium]